MPIPTLETTSLVLDLIKGSLNKAVITSMGLNLFSFNSLASNQNTSTPQLNTNMAAVGENGNPNWLIDLITPVII